jgi:hypothetical protein
MGRVYFTHVAPTGRMLMKVGRISELKFHNSRSRGFRFGGRKIAVSDRKVKSSNSTVVSGTKTAKRMKTLRIGFRTFMVR